VIRLGLRLAVSGGREAVVRLVVLAIAVGLGVGLLLTALAGINAVNAQNARHAWLWTGTVQEPVGHAPAGTDPLWWSTSGDTFSGQQIVRVDVAATGPTAPVPPGIPRDPAPGQYYASPALARLLRSTPADELADRYPGRLAGTTGDAALPSPNSLFIIVGHAAEQMAHRPDTIAVTTIPTTMPGINGVNPKGLQPPPDEGVGADGVDLIFSVVALALLTPVLIFIATATRLSAARREQRFAAMRLVGARPRQISLIAAVESTVAAIAGVAVGFGLFFVLRIPLANIPFTGEPFFPSDLSLSLRDVLAVAIGMPVAAAVVARLALRRVHISPLGVTRRATPKPPRAWRILPLLIGLAELGYFVVHGARPAFPGRPSCFCPAFC
jgi:FtsX-like permease family